MDKPEIDILNKKVRCLHFQPCQWYSNPLQSLNCMKSSEVSLIANLMIIFDLAIDSLLSEGFLFRGWGMLKCSRLHADPVILRLAINRRL